MGRSAVTHERGGGCVPGVAACGVGNGGGGDVRGKLGRRCAQGGALSGHPEYGEGQRRTLRRGDELVAFTPLPSFRTFSNLNKS